jgi:D-alanyl-D-alanine carboxypeptidase (penicillin-binding protein 5/6)
VALVLVVAVVVAIGVQLGRPVPAVAVQRTLPVMTPVTGATPVLPWPATGEAAVAVPQLGVALQSGPEAAVPIASLTKIMTAYLTLRDHPLAPTAQGPMLVMTAADQVEAFEDEEDGATNVPVQPGEELSERQLLNGLLVHSANNIADILARWDAGTLPAFVAKMNATAAALGMTHTHYADASGLDPGTAGTAGDELLVTQAAMRIPTFAAVVSQPAVTLPTVGVLNNYVSSVGTDGIVGVKSGFTQAAMGCLVLAGERTVAGHQVLVLAAVTGQPGVNPLDVANGVDEHLLDAVASGLREVPVTTSGIRVADVTRAWSPTIVPMVAARAITLLAWPGQQPRLALTMSPVRSGAKQGARVGSLAASIGDERVVVPVRVADSLVGPSVTWRLERS